MAWVAAVMAAGAIAKGVADSQGSNAQADSLSQGKAGITAERNKLQDFIDQQYAAEQPLRDAGQQYAAAGTSVLPTLQELATNPTMSEGYKLAMKEGLNTMQQDFATRGSPQSGPAAIAAGRFSAGLTAAERDRQIQNAQFLAALGPQAAVPLAGAGQQFYASMYPNIRAYNEDIGGFNVAQGNQAAQGWNQMGSNIAGGIQTLGSFYNPSGAGAGSTSMFNSSAGGFSLR